MGDPVTEAVAEAERRRAGSAADIGAEVDHYARVLAEICDEWRLMVHGWLPGGVSAPPLAVSTAAGTEAVLKLQPPGVLDVAAGVLQAADGVGYVRVLAWDAARGALLTERLGEDLWQHRTDLAGQILVLAPLLRQAWRVPLGAGGPVEHKAAGLIDILLRFGPHYGLHAPTAVAMAERYARELAGDEAAEVVCHGDPHAGNVLRRGNGWALIDCDGFVGERAYDLGVVLRDACHEFERANERRPGGGAQLLRRGCRLLADLGGADPDRVWRWGFVERVTTGLYLHWLGYPDQGDRFLRVAEALAGPVD